MVARRLSLISLLALKRLHARKGLLECNILTPFILDPAGCDVQGIEKGERDARYLEIGWI